MQKNKWICIAVICFLSFSLVGCWDVNNIEDRGFIIGSGIDLGEKGEGINQEVTITNQMVIPTGITSSSPGAGQGPAFLNFSATGKSIFKIEEDITALSSKIPFYEHVAVVVISEDVARKEHLFSHILDTYVRDVDMRRGIKVVVSKGEAKKLLEFTTPEEKLPSMLIDHLLVNSKKDIGLLKPQIVGDIEEYHLQNNSYVLPILEAKDHIEYKSGAVFHGRQDKMVGTFNYDDILNLEIFLNKPVGQIVTFDYKGSDFTLKVDDLKRKITVDPTNINEIKVKVDIKLSATIKESLGNINLQRHAELKEIHKAVSKKLKDSIEKTIEKGQEEYGADVFKIWKILETKHYNTWQKVKKDWEQGEYYFKKAKFEVTVDTDIYSIGVTNETD